MKKPTTLDLAALCALASGGDIAQSRFNRLCDLGLCGAENVITLKGSTLQRVERTWITEAGQRAIEAHPLFSKKMGSRG